MHRDEREELDRLQRALLAEEAAEEEQEWEEEQELGQEDDGPVGNVAVYRNYSNGYGRDLRNFASGYRAYDMEAEDEEEEPAPPPRPRKSNRGLWMLALALLAGILILVLIWAGRFRGVIPW